MEILACVLCFINGAALTAMAFLLWMHTRKGPKMTEEEKAASRAAVQFANLLSYDGSTKGQKEVGADEDEA